MKFLLDFADLRPLCDGEFQVFVGFAVVVFLHVCFNV